MEKTDAELMALVKRGDGEMLGYLYRRHSRAIAVALRRWYPRLSSIDTEDLVQEIFVELGRSAPSYEEQSKFSAWLYTIAHRKAVDFGRKQSRSDMAILNDPGDAAQKAMNCHRPIPERAVEMRQIIEQMLNRLPVELRQVIWLKVVEGFAAKEISEITGVEEGTVRTRLHRARELLMGCADSKDWRTALEGGRQ